MSKKLYVASLPFSVDSDQLEKMFSAIGTVTSAKIITNASTGQGKGFGFVEMATTEDAIEAINQLNGTSHGGRTILVAEAKSEVSNPKENPV